jgi:hypothetical protein
MPTDLVAKWFLAQEARALLTRLARLRPFALHMPMVTAAAISPAAQSAIETHMTKTRRKLRAMVNNFLRWLRGRESQTAPPAEAQRRFTFLRLRFNAVISQFEIFADVLTQRSQHETGVWVAGLDDVAADALELPGYYKAPPVICYLDRGHGAAIRRARTRLPGGDENPVAVIRVPRERMIGNGIASSLVHEVGHQAAELLDLMNSLRPVLQGMQRKGGPEEIAWRLYERWISEILADFWSVARVGITSTMGLMAVVSLPRAFVFRLDLEDPHPIPWIRVKLSAAMGDALYPHQQWNGLSRLWERFYPTTNLDPKLIGLLVMLETTIPAFVTLLVNHRPKTLRGRSLKEAMSVEERQPARLTALYQAWGGSPIAMRDAPPSVAFAVIGQARADGKMTPEDESRTLANLLNYWAARSAMSTSAICAEQPRRRVRERIPRPQSQCSMRIQ